MGARVGGSRGTELFHCGLAVLQKCAPEYEYVDEPKRERSSVAVAYQWAARIMTVSLEMVLPGLLGYWIDRRLGTRVVFTLIGFAVGNAMAIWHLIRITQSSRHQGGAGEERNSGP